jgi:hypothetical protein
MVHKHSNNLLSSDQLFVVNKLKMTSYIVKYKGFNAIDMAESVRIEKVNS